MKSAQVWICAALIVVFVASARVGVAQDRGHGTVAGVALDSLREAPLAGALVTVEGAGLSATTDSAGLFRIDSIPAGEWRLALFHPLLDTLRISLVTPRLRIADGASVNVVLAVPSALTLLHLKCGDEAGALLVGVVSRADQAVAPADATVQLGWIETQIGRGIGIRHRPVTMAAAVDADGLFHLCGIPPDVAGDLRAISGTDTSAAVPVSFDKSPVAIAGLLLPGADVEWVDLAPEVREAEAGSAQAVTSPVGAAVLRRGSALIVGRVRDGEGAAVASARVALEGAMGTAVTDSAGRFVLTNQPSGSGVLIVRKLGLAMVEVPVALTASRTNEVDVRMTEYIPILSEIVVRATRDLALERVGFNDRRHRRPGNLFLGPAEMDVRRNRMSLANILAEAPNLRYVRGGIHGRSRGVSSMEDGAVSRTCLNYLVDGYPWISGDPPTAWFRPEEVGAIEVYRVYEAPGDLPFSSFLRWDRRTGAACEIVVIWTRDKLRIR